MRVATVHADAVARDRELKPEIAATNPENGIPIRDLVELELRTEEGRELTSRAFPLVADLDALPEEAAIDFLRTIFEGGPRFLSRLAAARPFETDEGLIGAAHELGRSLDPDAQIELLDAHPRIGADPATVSALSRAEQGYGEANAPEAEPEAWIAEELETLNDAYERIFGFRFVIFVGGRPRSEILSILEPGAAGLQGAGAAPRGRRDRVHRCRPTRKDAWCGMRHEIRYGKADVRVYRTHAAPLRGVAPIPESPFTGRDNRSWAPPSRSSCVARHFSTAYTEGDNRRVVATDTMKNFIQTAALGCDAPTLEGWLREIGHRVPGDVPADGAAHDARASSFPSPAAVVPARGDGFALSDASSRGAGRPIDRLARPRARRRRR